MAQKDNQKSQDDVQVRVVRKGEKDGPSRPPKRSLLGRMCSHVSLLRKGQNK